MTDSRLPPKRQLPPWLLMFGVPILAFGLLVVFAVVAGKFAPSSVRPLDENDHVMTDCTILRIEKVSFGKNHELEFGSWGGGFPWRFWDAPRGHPHQFQTSTVDDQMVIFMSRRDAVTGQSLDFDWWGENVVTDTYGDSVRDSDDSQLYEASEDGADVVRQRPFKADHRQYKQWVVLSEWPPCRVPDGDLHVEVKNRDGKVVAKCDIKRIATVVPATPSWTAEPLPCTKSEGDFTVTLKAATIERHGTFDPADPTLKQLSLKPSLDVAWKGQPITNWRHEWLYAGDPTNNFLGHSPDINLSPHEPVLRVYFNIVKDRDAKFDASEQAAGATIDLPAVEQSVPQTNTATIGGVKLRLRSIGGSGKTVNPVPSALVGNNMYLIHPEGFTAFQEPMRITWGSEAIEIESRFPHLLFEPTGLMRQHRLYILVLDDRGRVVPNEEKFVDQNFRLAVLNPEPDAKSVTLTWTVTTAREFKFFIEQPERPALPEVKAAQ